MISWPKLSREMELSNRCKSMKDVEMLQNNGNYNYNLGEDSVDYGFKKNNIGYQISDQKNKKAWWNTLDKTVYVAGVGLGETECQLKWNNRPESLNNIQHAINANNFVYKHPNSFSSGQGKVACIGLRWTLPAIAHNKPSQTELRKKPMWSWLVTENTQSIKQKQKTKTRHFISTYLHQTSFNGHMQGVRKHHIRDIHPISTAMDRDGTSISRTKWEVPSCGTSRAGSQQPFLGHLELSKRVKCDILQCVSLGTRSNKV